MSSYFVVFRHQFECQWTCTSAVSAHAGHSIQGPYGVYIGTIFQKDYTYYTQFTKVHALTGSHWISLVPAVSPIAILCLRVNSLRTPCQLPPAPRSAKVLSMLRACSPLRIKSIKHQNEELQPKDANGGHRNRDARCKICSLSLKHETTRETQTNFSNLSTSTIH